MTYSLYALAAEHPGLALYALSLLLGVLPDALALLQRRGLGRRGGFRTRRRRRRAGGLLGTLVLLFVLGPLVLLALAAYAAYRYFGRWRGR